MTVEGASLGEDHSAEVAVVRQDEALLRPRQREDLFVVEVGQAALEDRAHVDTAMAEPGDDLDRDVHVREALRERHVPSAVRKVDEYVVAQRRLRPCDGRPNVLRPKNRV
jgi:hypothetical protein